jgi:hypothetical protein
MIAHWLQEHKGNRLVYSRLQTPTMPCISYSTLHSLARHLQPCPEGLCKRGCKSGICFSSPAVARTLGRKCRGAILPQRPPSSNAIFYGHAILSSQMATLGVLVPKRTSGDQFWSAHTCWAPDQTCAGTLIPSPFSPSTYNLRPNAP